VDSHGFGNNVRNEKLQLIKSSFLRKARPVDIEFSNALVPTLNEWNSKYDEEAYNDL